MSALVPFEFHLGPKSHIKKDVTAHVKHSRNCSKNSPVACIAGLPCTALAQCASELSTPYLSGLRIGPLGPRGGRIGAGTQSPSHHLCLSVQNAVSCVQKSHCCSFSHCSPASPEPHSLLLQLPFIQLPFPFCCCCY